MNNSHPSPKTTNLHTSNGATDHSTGVTENLAISPDQVNEVHNRPRVWGGLSKNAWIAIGVAIALLVLLLLI